MQGDENKKQVEILSFQMDLEKGAGHRSIVEQTIIDGGGVNPVITLLTANDESTVIRGFTLRNGRGRERNYIFSRPDVPSWPSTIITEYWAPCIDGNYTDAQIERCIIRENQGHEGLAGYRVASYIDCVIEDNIKLPTDEGLISYIHGHGIVIRNYGGLISGNVIRENDTGESLLDGSAFNDGGGLFCYNFIRGNTGGISGHSGPIFRNIFVESKYHGIGSGREGYITNNLILFNKGPGIYYSRIQLPSAPPTGWLTKQ